MNPSDYAIQIPIHSMPLVIEAGSGLSTRPFTHVDRTFDLSVLIYIKKGRMEIIEENITHTLTEGSLFFLKDNTHHWGEKPFEIGTHWLYVHFKTPAIKEDAYPFDKKNYFDTSSPIDPAEFKQYLTLPKHLKLPSTNPIEKKLTSLISYNGPDFLFRRNLILYDLLIDSIEVSHIEHTERSQQHVHKLLKLIKENYTQALRAKEIEDAIGLSYKYLSELFKRETGKTIKMYQTELRTTQAAKLLGETDLPIKSIASQVGYNDPLYFSKVFSNQFGYSPKIFRKKYQPPM